jgi:hypothetical protein
MKLLRAAGLVLIVLTQALAAQRQDLPPLYYTCPHHADHLQDGPGKCPMQMSTPDEICGMTLVPVRIEPEFWYTCPVHANVPKILGPKPGTCPLDGRQKMPVKVTVHWTCKHDPDEQLLEPGKCADGSTRIAAHEVRAHGDHNPRHGGYFFMAGDLWHHFEGTYPKAGLVRVYFYDNFTQPIDATRFAARLVLREEFDDATKTTREIDVVPLRPGPDKSVLDATLTADKLPLRVAVKIKFDANSREHRADFNFTEYTREPAPTTSPADLKVRPTPAR